MVRCEVCEHENTDGAEQCVHCSATLLPSALAAAGELELAPVDHGEKLRIAAPDPSGGYVLGRADSHDDYYPDIDLTDLGAQQHGVSRRHAALVCHRERVHLLDLGSSNGTFVNNRRLTASTPYPIANNDILQLGNLSLSISVVDD